MKTAWMYFSQPNVGGAQLSSLALADGLRGSGWKIDFCFSYYGPLIEECTHHGHDMDWLPMPEWYRFRYNKSFLFQIIWLIGTLFLATKIVFFLRRKRPDLIYLIGRRDVVLCAPAAKLLGIPMIYHLHGFGLGEIDFLSRLALKVTQWIKASAVFNSIHTLEIARRVGWHGDAPVIYNGIDFDPSWDMDRQMARGSFGTEPGKLVIGTASRISPGKNLETLIRAMANLKEKLPRDFILLIAGAEDIFQKGRLVKELKQLADDLKISDRIRWLGHCREMGRFYRALDIFILLTRFESFGRVFVEAMAAEVPTIGTRVGGVSEIIEDGKTGIFVGVDDAEGAARAVIKLLENPDWAATMARQGRESVRSRFSLEAHVHQMIEVFNQVVR